MSNAILLGIGLIDNTAKDLARISKNLRANGRNLASIGSELTMGITLPVVAAGGALLKFAGDLDGMKKALAANMGGLNQANAEFEKLKELAKAPGIGLEEAIKGSYRLQGLGESANEARHQMANFAKVVSLSGGGEAQFGGLLQQFTQMKGVGKILGGDIRFMIENAPVLGKVLNDAFGTANPEKLRDMGITVDQLIEGMMTQMDKLQGIGGSVKNTLENLWTSIRIGGGEIGLAILSVTGMGDSLEDLSSNIDKSATAAAKWIKENKGAVNALKDLIIVMAVTGPIARFIGNISMIGGLILALPNKLRNATLAIREFNAASNGIGAGAAAGIAALALAANQIVLKPIINHLGELNAKMNETANIMGKFGADDRIRNFLQALMEFQTFQFGKGMSTMGVAFGGMALPTVTDQQKQSARELMDILNPYGHRVNNPQFDGKATKTKYGGGGGGDLKAAQDAYEARIRLQREMEQMFAESPVKSRLDSLPAQRGFDELANKKISPNKVPIEQSDTKILKEYAAALAQIGVEQNLGATTLDLMKMKVDAAASAYRDMAGTYGTASEQAVTALAAWKTATDEQTDAQKKQNAELEKTNKIMQYAQALTDGVSEAVSGLLSKGGGFEDFAKGILKAALAMMKLAVADFVAKTIGTLGFVGAIPAIIGGGALIGGMDALMNSISLADGGLLTGETMVRAGEYPTAHVDPEVISPVSKIQKYIREAVGNGGGGGGESVIWGDHILITTSKAQGRANRRGSGNLITF